MPQMLKYLFLDDNDKIIRDGDVSLFNKFSSRLNIETAYPSNWSMRSKKIIDDLNEIDGLILDWELRNKSDAAKEGIVLEDVDFSAESLAEHLRVCVVQQGIKDIPIIICSADNNKTFTKARKGEKTSSDLFDLAFIKGDLFTAAQVPIAEAKLFDLAISYSSLQSKSHSSYDVLAIQQTPNIDIRFIDLLEHIISTKTTHDTIQFLLREVIEKEGVLINESIIAARLGVDIDKSAREWSAVLQKLDDEKIRYSGILSQGWKNYWAYKLVDWWKEKIADLDLRTTAASRRVELLNKALNLKLVPAEKIKYCSSDEFWTVCKGLKRPLDPIDGFVIGETDCKPWQDAEYISGLGELEKMTTVRINVLDRERYNRFKQLIMAKK